MSKTDPRAQKEKSGEKAPVDLDDVRGDQLQPKPGAEKGKG